MADVKTVDKPRESISNCRVRVREFNNKIKDAQLGSIYDDVPCKDCEKTILKEASELNDECGRLINHYNKDEVSPSQITKVCCITCSKEDIGNASHDNTCIKEVMSRTRKRIRQYNDHLDDLGLKDADGRPCRKCKESTLRECQALVKELQKAKDQFQESSMKNKFPCDYGFECANVAMRNGAKGRSKMKQSQHDSGYHSVNSEILGKEPTESMDDNQTASPDTTHLKDLKTDTHTEPPSSSCDKADVKGPCVTLDVSMADSNTTDA